MTRRLGPRRRYGRTAALALGLLGLAGVGRAAAQVEPCSNCGPGPTPPPARAAPAVFATPHHSGIRDVAQGSATVTYTTPAYVSRDEERSVTLVFNSGQARPRGLVQVDAIASSAEQPVRLSIRLRRPDGSWVDFVGGGQEIHYLYESGYGLMRLAAQFDATNLASGAHRYDVVVRAYWSDGSFHEAPALPVRVLIVNERQSGVGFGWSIAGVQRLIDQGDGLAVLEGDGRVLWFTRDCPSCSTYTPPEGEFSTLSWTGSVYERRYPDGTLVRFNVAGQQTRVQDRFGSATTYAYASGRLTSITDPAGRAITLGYSGGYLAWIEDPFQRRVTTLVSGMLLYHITDPDGRVALDLDFGGERLNGYWPHRTGRGVGGDAARWHFEYDAWDRVALMRAPTVAVDAGGVAARPETRVRAVEAAGLPPGGRGSAANPALPVRAAEVRVEVTTPRGHLTRIALDRFGLPTRIEEPRGRTTVLVRNAHGQITRAINPAGGITDYGWAGVQLRQVYNHVTQQTVQYTYEPTFNQVLTVSGDAQFRRFFYSGATQRLDSLRVGADSSKYTTHVVMDALGRVTRVTEPAPSRRETRFDYSTSGNPLQNLRWTEVGITSFRRTTYGYDTYGRTASVTNPQGHLTQTEYDLVNRVTRTVDELGHATRYEYGPQQLERVIDALGQVYGFAYNVLGWLERETDPLGRPLEYRYDRNGNLVRQTNRRNQVASFAYDELDRPLWRDQHEGVRTSYEYDPLDRWVRATHPNTGTEEVRFDAAGRKTQELSRGHVLTSTYERRGLRTGVQLSGPWQRAVGYRYDHLLQLERLIDLAGDTTRLTYTANGLPSSMRLPSGLTSELRFSSVYRAVQGTFEGGAAAQLGYVTSHNQRGYERDRSFVSSLAQIRRFRYDNAGRLTGMLDDQREPSETCDSQQRDPDSGGCSGPSAPGKSWTPSRIYGYDAVGNRTDEGHGIVTTGNRLVQFHGYAMTYDADGNLLSKVGPGLTQSFTWNSLGQLTSVTTNGYTAAYFYNGWDQLATRIDAWSIYRYLYDGDNLFMEWLDGWGEPHRVYAMYPGVDRLHSLEVWTPDTPRAHFYYATDELGSVLGLTDRTGQVVASYRYDPWGSIEQASSSVPNPIAFAGRYRDWPMALYYNRNRWYDPHLGRFLSEDPIGLAGGINLYAYANNNPGNYTDPFGLCPTKEVRVQVGWVDDKDPWLCGDGDRFGDRRNGMSANFGNRGIKQNTSPRPGVSGRKRSAQSGSWSGSQCLAAVALGTGGSASSLKEFQHIRGAGTHLQWRGANNKWYASTWGGNGSTGGRTGALAAGQHARIASRAFGGAGILLGVGQSVYSLHEGDYLGAGVYALDAVMAGVGTFGGPIGLGVNLAYLAVTHYATC